MLDSDARLHGVIRVLRTILPAAVLVVPAVALASSGTGSGSGSGQVWVTNCNQARYKPKVIFIACGDGTDYLSKLTWSKWTATGASGKGTNEFNACNPDCASGHFTAYPVTIALSKPTSCHKQKHRVFNDLKLTYTGTHPKGVKRTSTISLGCPFAP